MRGSVDAVRPVLGVSACLLGEAVRYDGGHKRDRFLVERLGPHVDWVPFCPEQEAGLGVPREAVRLERHDGRVRVVGTESRVDRTDLLVGQARLRLGELAGRGLAGTVLKADSPSCGRAGVAVHDASGRPVGTASGRFAAALRAAWPDLPLGEERDLADPRRREALVAAFFARARWLALGGAGAAPADLVAYHEDHALLLASRDRRAPQRLSRVLVEEGPARYRAAFAATLARVPGWSDHLRALREAQVGLRSRLDLARRRAVEAAVVAYAEGRAPLAGPVRRLRDLARAHDPERLGRAAYLAPHPDALGLLEAL